MPKIFVTPCTKSKQRKYIYLRWIFRTKSLDKQHIDNKKLLSAGKAFSQGKFDKTVSESTALHLARQTRLNVQRTLAQQTFSETSNSKLNNSIAVPISEILEDISQNISKMDQNLYTTKANMEEILRTNFNDNEFISLD